MDAFRSQFPQNNNERKKHMKIKINTIHAAFPVLAFTWFALIQNAQALSPPPDGGYPGANTAEGQNALFSLTGGGYNTAVGYYSLKSDTTGSFNTATGAGTLLANTGDNNTAAGAGALFRNSTGVANTADGAFTLFNNTTGPGNTGSGYQALFTNQTGANNAAYGYTALYHNTADFNTAFGSQTLVYNTTGANNTAVGYQALVFSTDGQGNTAIGQGALYSNQIGDFNTASGNSALASNRTGSWNTASGFEALPLNISGDHNIAIGHQAGYSITGSYNIDIGAPGIAGESNTVRIGDSDHTAAYIAGIAGQTVSTGGTTCYVDIFGKLGVNLSARRFKTDIADMAAASEGLLALRPVTFHYKPELDKTGIPQFGLVAEEVVKVNPDLVARDAKGELSTVRYEAVNAMLLNEFLKEHRKVAKQACEIQEQRATIADLKSDAVSYQAIVSQLRREIDAVIAHSKEQDLQIQKVSAQIELNRPAPRVVADSP